ncbi:MAG TPA: NUDIX domain-containing protein [Bacilli bacterium]|nr:NUDIX domain-containing protein [Bacilli bacterium]
MHQEMNRLFPMTVVFLQHGDDLLFLHRSEKKKIFPGVWSGAGGKVDPGEHNALRAAALREVREETGITEDRITNFRLKYVILRQKDGAFWQTYVYFGETEQREVAQTEEGVFTWLPHDGWQDKDVIPTTRASLLHYAEHQDDGVVYVGVYDPTDEALPIKQWIPLG